MSKEVELTSGCIIGTSCNLTEREVVPENTIIYGSNCQRREMNDKPYVSDSFCKNIFVKSCNKLQELKINLFFYFSLKLDN